MPGVSDASVSYENAIARGANLAVDVYVPTATGQQITDVMDEMNRVRGDDFDKFSQQIEFHPTGSPTVSVARGGALSSGDIADQCVRLRRIAATVSAGEMTWRDSDPSRIELFDLDTAVPETIGAIRDAVGDQMVAAELRPHLPSTQTPTWQVLFPLSAPQQASIDAELAALPVRPSFISVKNAATLFSMSL